LRKKQSAASVYSNWRTAHCWLRVDSASANVAPIEDFRGVHKNRHCNHRIFASKLMVGWLHPAVGHLETFSGFRVRDLSGNGKKQSDASRTKAKHRSIVRTVASTT
jgi:hypothetical protein